MPPWDSTEIELERGVLVEEWRRGRGAVGRMRDQIIPLLLEGSRYAKRLPIGDTLSLKTAPVEAVSRFYSRWYRPDLMTIVLVGDIPSSELKTLVHQHLSDLQGPHAPVERTRYAVPSVPEDTV